MGERIAKLMISVLFGWMVFSYFQFGPLVSFSYFEVVLDSEQEGTLFFQYRYDDFEPKFSEKRTRHMPYGVGEQLKFSTKLRNARISDVRIIFEEEKTVDIRQLSFYSFYRDTVHMSAEEVARHMQVENAEITLLDNNRLHFEATGALPSITLKFNELYGGQTALSIAVPILAAGALFLLLWNWQWHQSVIYRDLVMTSGNGHHINALDGLRGLAALTVVGDHAWGWLSGSGTFGVWIFFALSGFLLLQPLIRQPDRGLDVKYIIGYLRRRVLRIIPLYYTLLLGLYLAGRKIDVMFQHMLFIRGDAHLWTLPEEIFFYLCLPFIAILLALCAKISRVLALLVLIGLWLILVFNPKIIPIEAYLFNGKYHMHLGWFLGGGVAAYLLYLQGEREIPVRVQHILSVVAAIVFIGALLYSSIPVYEILYGKHFPAAKFKPLPFAFISAFLVWAIAITPKGLVSRFLSLPLLRWMGLVGFGIYLFHPAILFALDAVFVQATGHMPDGKLRFLFTTIFSLWFASITYKLIERPFLQIAKVKV